MPTSGAKRPRYTERLLDLTLIIGSFDFKRNDSTSHLHEEVHFSLSCRFPVMEGNIICHEGGCYIILRQSAHETLCKLVENDLFRQSRHLDEQARIKEVQFEISKGFLYG